MEGNRPILFGVVIFGTMKCSYVKQLRECEFKKYQLITQKIQFEFIKNSHQSQ
jgi:hypothetical protein